ncbi:MAG: GGDEF domain-containing protein [Pseudomonadota bacterium]
MENRPAGPSSEARRLNAYLIYASLLCATAAAAVVAAFAQHGPSALADDWRVPAFLLAYGVFTITMGYPHPTFGHVSFDRVAQLASVLILGPVDAAWINGLASFLYPWHRLWRGVSLKAVVAAALNNCGLMTLVVLAAGLLYTSLGGPVPLTALDAGALGLLVLVLIVMQVLNDAGMMIAFYLQAKPPAKVFSGFATLAELAGGLIGVLVAIVFNRLGLAEFALLLTVLSLGMLVHRQFAFIRLRLELLVEDRTRKLREKSLELERQATQDKLTRLFNRRYADGFVERQIEAARRHGHTLTVALVDIDYFKAINDRFSHAKGDQVLRQISTLLAERCRKTDMVARYGGEEFLLCFPETSVAQAEHLCEQLRAGVEAYDWSTLAPGATVTLSFGIAGWTADASRKQLVAAADTKLYEAKHNGRNQIAV